MKHIRHKTSAAILFAAYINLEVVLVAATVTGPTWRRAFDLSEVQLGLCLGAVQTGMLLASLLAGRVTERQGPLRILTAALTAVLLALVVVAASGDFYTLFAGLAAAGICAAATHNAGATLLSGLFHGNVRRIMALASALWFGSSVLSAPLIGAWLDLAARSGWSDWGFRAPFLVMLVLLGGCLALVRLRIPDSAAAAAEQGPSQGKSDNPDAARPTLEWVWVPFLSFCHGMMVVSLVAWLSPMAQTVFGVADFLGSLLFAGAALGLATGRLLLSLMRVRWDDRAALAACGCTGAIVLTLALHMPSYLLTLIFTTMGTLSASLTAPCLFSVVAERFLRTRSRLFGYMEASIAAAAMAGAFLVGLLADQGVPLRTAMHLSPAAALTLGLGALLWKSAWPGRPDEKASSGSAA
jgi:MFS family permease